MPIVPLVPNKAKLFETLGGLCLPSDTFPTSQKVLPLHNGDPVFVCFEGKSVSRALAPLLLGVKPKRTVETNTYYAKTF